MIESCTYIQAPQLLPEEDQYVVVRDKITTYFSHSDTTDLIRAEVKVFFCCSESRVQRLFAAVPHLCNR